MSHTEAEGDLVHDDTLICAWQNRDEYMFIFTIQTRKS